MEVGAPDHLGVGCHFKTGIARIRAIHGQTSRSVKIYRSRHYKCNVLRLEMFEEPTHKRRLLFALGSKISFNEDINKTETDRQITSGF